MISFILKKMGIVIRNFVSIIVYWLFLLLNLLLIVCESLLMLLDFFKNCLNIVLRLIMVVINFSVLFIFDCIEVSMLVFCIFVLRLINVVVMRIVIKVCIFFIIIK